MTRLEALKEQLFNDFYQKKEWWGDELTILDQEGVEKKPLIIRKAMAFDMVCRKMPLEVKNHELIVGKPTMSSVAFGHTFPRYETGEEAEEFARISLSRKSVWGHHMPYYPKVLAKGYTGIIADIDRKLQELGPQEQEKRNFYEAMKATLESASVVPQRYVKYITELLKSQKDFQRKEELLKIREACQRVPQYPARSFQEALQSVWFVHMLLHSTLSYTPLGRIDQYLWPYYEKDINNGVITREYAKDLIGSFLVKFNERTQFLKEHMENHVDPGDWSQGGDPSEPTATFDMENNADYTFGQSANHWLQTATVSGLTPDGKDATNDLSYLFIEVINELELISPMIGARLHRNTPGKFLSFVSQQLCKGGAQPVIFNDEVIVKGMVERLGIPIEDARDYSSDGCWETLVYGKTEYNYGHIELLLCMEALINRGKSLIKNVKIGKDMGADITGKLDTFDKFYEAFMEQVRYRIEQAIKNKIKYYDEVHKIAPEPYLSAFVEDCIEKGRDLTDKGARYLIYSLFATGLSHCIDSLAALKKVVYDEQVVSLPEMIQAVKANWEGYEGLRQICLNKAPKYGTDNDEADQIMVRFLRDFCDCADEWNKKMDWIYVGAGVATFENYPRFGNNAAASFDGRLAHEAFSSNFSPAVGRDKEGPTAVILSSTKFDLSRLNSGCPVDLRMSFNKETEEQNGEILQGFIEGFVHSGGNIMTITKVDTMTLKKAQKEPEKYRSLRVRLGGVTAYFVQLARPQQDEYIKRTEHVI